MRRHICSKMIWNCYHIEGSDFVLCCTQRDLCSLEREFFLFLHSLFYCRLMLMPETTFSISYGWFEENIVVITIQVICRFKYGGKTFKGVYLMIICLPVYNVFNFLRKLILSSIYQCSSSQYGISIEKMYIKFRSWSLRSICFFWHCC